MASTEAAHLSRLKVEYGQDWQIGRGQVSGFTAEHRTARDWLWAKTTPELESVLAERAARQGSEEPRTEVGPA